MRLRDRLIQENVYLQHEVKSAPRLDGGRWGRARRFAACSTQVEQVGPTGATVLLSGETGTGKELVATAIHERSSRGAPRDGARQLRGDPGGVDRERAVRPREGRLHRRADAADRPVRARRRLDDLPRRDRRAAGRLQVKLLRVLQERQIERLGGSRPIDVDVRVIAATNRDLEQAVADGAFREDLYYRLNVFPIRVPPLRERAGRHPDARLGVRRRVLEGARQAHRVDLEGAHGWRCSGIRGRATSASCATSSSAP